MNNRYIKFDTKEEAERLLQRMEEYTSIKWHTWNRPTWYTHSRSTGYIKLNLDDEMITYTSEDQSVYYTVGCYIKHYLSDPIEQVTRERTRFKVWQHVRFKSRKRNEWKSWKIINILDWGLELQSPWIPINKETNQTKLNDLELVRDDRDMDDNLYDYKVWDIVEIDDDSEYEWVRLEVKERNIEDWWEVYRLTNEDYRVTRRWYALKKYVETIDTSTSYTDSPVVSYTTDTYTSWSSTPTKEEIEEMMKPFLTPKKKPMKTYNDYKVEDFISKDKNRKAIDNAMETLKEYDALIYRARWDLMEVWTVTTQDICDLEKAISDLDIETIQRILEELKGTKEYLDTYLKNTIESVGKEEITTKRSIEDKFKR